MHAADHDHGKQLAGKGHRDRLGGGHAVVERQQYAGEAGQARRGHEGGELDAIGGIADEAGALLVLADRHQHAAQGRPVEAPQRQHGDERDARDQRVVARGALERHADEDRAA
jgi:hypothetical protein